MQIMDVIREILNNGPLGLLSFMEQEHGIVTIFSNSFHITDHAHVVLLIYGNEISIQFGY